MPQVRKCFAPGCVNTYTAGCESSFFRFPSEPARCQKWIRFCGLEDRYRLAREVPQNVKVCIKHFNKKDYYNCGTKVYLNRTAVPSIHSNGTIIEQPISKAVAIASPTSVPPVTLSPCRSPAVRHKVVRTYARRAKFGNSVTSETRGGDGPSLLSQSSSPSVILPDSPTGRWQGGRRLFSSPVASSTPIEAKKNIINGLRCKVRRLERKLAHLECINGEMPELPKIIKATESLLPPTLHKLFIAQLQINNINKHGRRWCEGIKDFSLSLYYHSPRSYKFMSKVFNLPSVRTLRNFQSKVDIRPGLIPSVLATLKELANGPMSDKSDSVCTLILDELSIREHLQYDSTSDLIVGLADNGSHRYPLKGNNCLMAMVKGIKKGWKQVVGFWIGNNAFPAKTLMEILTLCVTELTAAGLRVKVLICDQGCNNQSMAKMLGVTAAKPNFEMCGTTVHFMYDPPHLLKSIRNNLLKYDLMVGTNVVSWSYLRSVYKMEDDNLKVKMLPKVTSQHIYPQIFTRMKVKLAAQALSNSMHVAILVYVAIGKLPNEAVYTARFIETMDKLFDTFNSMNFQVNKLKLRYALTTDSGHCQFLSDVLCDIETWKFIDCLHQPACLDGWRITIQSLLNLFQELCSEYSIPKLRTRLLSQDCIENTFAIIRQQNGCNANPTAQQIGSGLRHLLITSLSKVSAQSNCEADVEYVLTSLGRLTIPDKSLDMPCKHVLPNVSLECIMMSDGGVPDTGNTQDGNAVYYISGYICSKFLKNHKCIQCEQILILKEQHERVLSEDHQIFAYFKAFDKDFGGLTLPRHEVFLQFREWENTFCRHFLSMLHRTRLREAMCELLNTRFFSLCSLEKFHDLLHLYIDMRIKWSVRFLNRRDQFDRSCQRKLRILNHT